jgi:hypothetical protein
VIGADLGRVDEERDEEQHCRDYAEHDEPLS